MGELIVQLIPVALGVVLSPLAIIALVIGALQLEKAVTALL